MPYDIGDTICAIATAAGGAARGMVRVSGSDAVSIVAQLFRPDGGRPLDSVPHATALSGCVSVGRTILSARDELEATDTDVRPTVDLPCDLFLWPGPRSYTRQPVAELHTLGSPPLLQALVDALCRAGARLAEPGEFTLRAFLAGRIDLTQAEAVLGIIDARGDEELSAALIQLAGGLARPLQSLRDNLLQLLADLEAGLDFVEEDIEFVAREEVLDRLRLAEHSLHEVAQQMASRSTAAQTAQVALIGPSNVGKSSLFNALVARFALDPCSSARTPLPALVSPRRGTTRDYLTATIDLGGLRCELVDTAGVDESFDAIQSSPPEDARSMIDTAAQALAKERRKRAAIRIWCVEASEDLPLAKPGDSRIAVVAWTKSDVCRPTSKHRSELPQHAPFVITSSRTGEGLDELRVACRQLLRDGAVAQHGQVVDVTAERCRESIRLAQAALQRAMEIAVCHGGDELLTAELRNALAELGKVVGAVYTDDLLDRIFSSFCIGK